MSLERDQRDASTLATSVSPPIEARIAAAGLPPLPRASWLEVDLGVLAANGRSLRAGLPPDTRLGVVVKADGYGHGLVATGRAAARGGAEVLLVATLDEALVLRDAGIDTRILVLYPVPSSGLERALDARLELVAMDEASVSALAAVLGSSPAAAREARVHLGIDTGMSRGGFAPEAAAEAARRLLDAGLPALAGTWSHLATPEDAGVTAAQVARLDEAFAALAAAAIDPGERHMDATGGLIGGGGPPFDLVRAGLAFYGVLPPELPIPPALEPLASRLRPALSLHGRAATVTRIAAGASVGYGGTWTASRPSVIATVGIGYADGWARSYAPGWAIVRGVRVAIVGRVSSDALALDVTDVTEFRPDDEVVLLGDPPAMTVHDLAALRGSIAWEVLDAFAPRLSRVYVEDGEVVGVRYLDGQTRFAPGRESQPRDTGAS